MFRARYCARRSRATRRRPLERPDTDSLQGDEFHGVPLSRQQRPEGLRDQLRQLGDPRVPGRGRSGDRMRTGRAGGRDHDLRHRRRVRERQGRVDPRRRAGRRAARGAGDLHQGLLPHRRARSQRHRALPQAHPRVDQQLAEAAADRLRRPLPGSPVRPLHAARGDHGGIRRRRPGRQGALHRGQRVDARTSSAPGTRWPAS